MPKRKTPVRSKKAPRKSQTATKKTRSTKKRTELKSSEWYGKAAESLAIRRGNS
jgi:hypothetical protein